MIVDLISPWLTALESTAPSARAAFRERHAALLALADAENTDGGLVTDAAQVRLLARRAADPAWQEALREHGRRATALGADQCHTIALVARDEGHDAVYTINAGEPAVVLSLTHLGDDDAIVVALARGMATLARQRSPHSAAPQGVRDALTLPSLAAARDVPLREWIYDAGIAAHLATAIAPTLAPHTLFGLHHSAFNRMRERENTLRALLDRDLDERGIGLVLRWLTPTTAQGPRTIGDVVIPPMAGQYLGWRMTAERAERMEMREMLVAEA